MRIVRVQVKFFALTKGYGFLVSPEIDGDIFVHATALKLDGWTHLKPFQEFIAEVERGPKGWHAYRLHEQNS